MDAFNPAQYPERYPFEVIDSRPSEPPLTATTSPTRVLTEAQYDELWKLFCQYGRLRRDKARLWDESPFDRVAWEAKGREIDGVREQYARLLASLTMLGTEAVRGS